MKTILSTTRHHLDDERGAVAAEYAVLMALIIIAMLVVIQGLTGGIVNTFQAIIDVLP